MDFESYLNPQKLIDNYINVFKDLAEHPDIPEDEKNKIKQLLINQQDVVNKLTVLENKEVNTRRKDFEEYMTKISTLFDKLKGSFKAIKDELDLLIVFRDQDQEEAYYKIEITSTPSDALNKKLTDFINDQIDDGLKKITVTIEEFNEIVDQLPPNEIKKLPKRESILYNGIIETINMDVRKQQYEQWSDLIVFKSVECPEEREVNLQERMKQVATRIAEGQERMEGKHVEQDAENSEDESIESCSAEEESDIEILEEGQPAVNRNEQKAQSEENNSDSDIIFVSDSDISDSSEIEFIGVKRPNVVTPPSIVRTRESRLDPSSDYLELLEKTGNNLKGLREYAFSDEIDPAELPILESSENSVTKRKNEVKASSSNNINSNNTEKKQRFSEAKND